VGPNNEILSDGTYTYSYDAEGNCTERVNIATGADTDYTWDLRNRLTEVPGTRPKPTYGPHDAAAPNETGLPDDVSDKPVVDIS
jgi:hypothetical protein